MSIIVRGIESINTVVDLIPRTIGNVRLPTALSPFKSAISPRGPKIKKKEKKNSAAYITGRKQEKKLLLLQLLFIVVVKAAVPPNKDNNPAPAAVTTVFKGNLSFRFNFG